MTALSRVSGEAGLSSYETVEEAGQIQTREGKCVCTQVHAPVSLAGARWRIWLRAGQPSQRWAPQPKPGTTEGAMEYEETQPCSVAWNRGTLLGSRVALLDAF